MKLNRADQDFLLIHAFFGFFSAFMLAATTLPLGWRILVIVIAYNLLIPFFARRVGYKGWFELWSFSLPLSMLQIFPDWWLSQGLGILVFPNTGVPFIGTVPIFMAGMWVIPFFIIIYLGRRFQGKFSGLVAALASGVIFLGSEATLWALPVWYAQNVTQAAHIALYLIIPEILLGYTALRAFEWSLGKSFFKKLGAALAVMLGYLININLFYFVIEKIILK